MELEFGFGNTVQKVSVPDKNVIGVLHANEVKHELEGADEVRRALANPIGAPLLKEVVRPGEKVAIVTSDITRPMPTYVVMPPLLDALYEAGVKKEDITLVFALGSHRHHTPEEMKKLAGERAYAEIKCVDSDPTDCVHMGVTSHGTPVDVFRTVRRQTAGSAWEILSTIILPVTAAAPRRLCREFPPGRPFRAITARWSAKTPAPENWREIPSGRTLRRPVPSAALTIFSMWCWTNISM